MTKENTFREKGRAVFLAALMVLSIVAMSASFAGAAAATNEESIDALDADDAVDDSTTYWEGQELAFTHEDGLEGNFELREYDGDDEVGSLETQFTLDADNNHTAIIDTEGLEGEYVIEDPEGDVVSVDDGVATSSHSEDVGATAWEVAQQSFDVEFESDSTDDNTDDFEVEFDSNRGSYVVNASADGDLDNDELEDIFADFDNVEDAHDEEISLGELTDGTYELDFSGISSGEYEFSFDVQDTAAEATQTVNVSETEDADRAIESVSADRGEIVNISAELTETNDAAIQIGEYEDVAYEVVLELDDSIDTDELVIEVNTHHAGGHDGWSEEEAYEIYEANSSDTVDFNVVYENISGDELAGPLADGDYELTIGDEWNTTSEEIENDQDSALLTLQPVGEPGDVATHTAPEDDDLEGLDDFEDATVTETDQIAYEDSLIVTVDDFGSTGALAGFDDGEDIADVLAGSGVYIELEEQDSAANVDPEVWNNTDSVENDLELNFVNAEDYDGELLILEIPYDELSDELDSDAGYDLTFQVTDENPYIDDEDFDLTVETEFDINDRELALDDINEELPNNDNVSVTGETNVAPGTEINVRAQSTGNFVMDDDSTVDSDYTFAGYFDFSGYENGTEVDLTASEPVSEDDELEAVLFDGEEANVVVEADAPSDATVGEDATLDVTITNNGGAAADDIDIGVVIGGDNVDEDTESLDADESWTSSYEFTSDAEGDVEWSVTADDAEETGTTNFSADDGDADEGDADEGDADEGDADEGDADEGDADEGDADEGDDDGEDDDGTPGFGVAVALAALLGAAMLALRKQN